MSQLVNIRASYPLVKSLYGIEANTDDFEEVALAGWELIGNKHTRLYRYIGSTINGELELPCNVDVIESVHIPVVDAQLTSNKINYIDTDSVLVESYIDAWNSGTDPFNQKGKYVKYKEGDNVLYFNDIKVQFIPTPGHSVSSVCLLIENMLFTGDAMLLSKPVIIKRSGGNREAYQQSVKKLIRSVSKNTMIFPGHGEPFQLNEYAKQLEPINWATSYN